MHNRSLTLIIALYALPVAVLSFYASLFFTPNHSLGILTTGLLLTSIGSILLYLSVPSLDHDPVIETPSISPSSENLPISPTIEEQKQNDENLELLLESQQHVHLLSQQIDNLLLEIAELSQKNAEIIKLLEVNKDEFLSFQEEAKEEQDQTRLLLHEHRHTINEQRESLEKKQQQISQLESQVRDLNYEIKTLMDVEERQSIIRFPGERYHPKELDFNQFDLEDDEMTSPPPHVNGPEEASQQLKRCLDIAQKITGGQYSHHRSSRLKDLPVESTALEMRRLFDNLRSENQVTILLYSPKDNQMLFVNNPIKSLLGWTPEKFVQQFQELLADGGEGWKQSINQLSFKNETQASLWIASKSGQHVSIKCHLGLIPTGSFRHYVIGVAYKDTESVF